MAYSITEKKIYNFTGYFQELIELLRQVEEVQEKESKEKS